MRGSKLINVKSCLVTWLPFWVPKWVTLSNSQTVSLRRSKGNPLKVYGICKQ